LDVVNRISYLAAAGVEELVSRRSSASPQKAMLASGLLISWATPAARKTDAGQALRAHELPAALV